MKKCTLTTNRFALLLGLSLGLGAASLHAGDSNSGGFYIGTDAGLNLMDNLKIIGGGSVSTSPGFRWDLSMGYAFKLSDHLTLGPELETGILYNSLDQATPLGGVSHPANGQYYQVPALASGVLNWHFNEHWVAYVGAGGGVDVSTISSGNNIGNETDGAWQLTAGVRYKFGSSDLGLGYKYLAFTPTGLKTVGNNAILASYTFHF